MTRQSRIGALAVLLLLAATVHAETIAVVNLPDRVTIDAPRVALGAVARIDAADPDVMQRLDGVLVGLAPLPGERRVLARGEIAQALALAGYSPWDVEIRGAHAIELLRFARPLADRDVADAFRRELAEALGLPEERIALRRLELSGTPRVGGGRIELRTELLDTLRLGAPLAARVLVLEDGIASARVDAIVEAVLREGLDEGGPSPERRSVPRRERLVRSGQPVTLNLVGAGLQISAAGKARSSGRLGDEVSVENVISGVVVRGIVRGEGRVDVLWSSTSGLERSRTP